MVVDVRQYRILNGSFLVGQRHSPSTDLFLYCSFKVRRIHRPQNVLYPWSFISGLR